MKDLDNNFVVGAGVTGIGAAKGSGLTVFEKSSEIGGICRTYYRVPDHPLRQTTRNSDASDYRFEFGGGHWLFGANEADLTAVFGSAKFDRSSRKSSVFFPDTGITIPFPIQNHLSYFSDPIRTRIRDEILSAGPFQGTTMDEWLIHHFGPTLSELFFLPFNNLYTAGLMHFISPQDSYKSPVDRDAIRAGADGRSVPSGYNAEFFYPREGFGTVLNETAKSCKIRFGKELVSIDPANRVALFSDSDCRAFGTILSTVPLNVMTRIAGLQTASREDPYTSVLVLNIAARKGKHCPDVHWMYVPVSKSGFHRIGFYSNVSDTFLPFSPNRSKELVSIYVERSYRGGDRPTQVEVDAYAQSVVGELRSWGIIGEEIIIDPTWVDTAYTWTSPGSVWREEAIRLLEGCGIVQIGRYGAWKFQGIMDSVREGQNSGKAFARG